MLELRPSASNGPLRNLTTNSKFDMMRPPDILASGVEAGLEPSSALAHESLSPHRIGNWRHLPRILADC